MSWPVPQESFLSPHFQRRELECPCCHELGLDPLLLVGLEWLRGLVEQSIKVNSGYRCIAHNQAIGGEANSQHLEGRAADIVVAGMTPIQLKNWAQEIPYFNHGGIGLYQTFLHVDVRRTRARW